mgnify:CR=1 FL=1
MALGNALAMRPKSEEPSINITSMMDMFTIILFFLLSSYGSKPVEFTVDKDVELPKSTATFDYSNSIKLFLSDSSIKIEEDLIARLKNGKVVGLNVDKPESSGLYIKLKQYYEKQLAEATRVAQETGEEAKTDFHVLFFCDRHLSFKTMNSIIKVAAMAGYPNFQLAVLEK